MNSGLEGPLPARSGRTTFKIHDLKAIIHCCIKGKFFDMSVWDIAYATVGNRNSVNASKQCCS